MSENSRSWGVAQRALQETLDAEMAEVIAAIKDRPGPQSPYYIELPERYSVDLDVTDLMSLVARTANTYGRLARFAGIAKAQLDLAEGQYKSQYKSNLFGKNDKEREANAMKSAREQHDAWLTSQAIYSMADRMETSARIASESARKLLDKVQAMQIATHREAHGALKDEDFKTY